MKVKIKLFAQLAEVIAPEVELDLPNEIDKSIILQQLIEACPTQEKLISVSNVAVNQTYIYDEKVELSEVVEIAVIPPVSGG